MFDNCLQCGELTKHGKVLRLGECGHPYDTGGSISVIHVCPDCEDALKVQLFDLICDIKNAQQPERTV